MFFKILFILNKEAASHLYSGFNIMLKSSIGPEGCFCRSGAEYEDEKGMEGAHTQRYPSY